MNTTSSLNKDYVASHLRSQLCTLRSVLKSIESQNLLESDYASESLKRVEINLRKLRKTCKQS